MLRVVTATVGPLPIAPGSNGASQTVETYNAGDGTLSLSVSSSVPWITPSVGAARPCTTTRAATSCIPLVFALNTASLAESPRGYTGIVTVTAPGAVDAPQTITVTVQVGNDVEPGYDVYVAPGGNVGIPFASTDSPFDYTLTTQDGANWLSLAVILPFQGTLCGGPNPPPNGCTFIYTIEIVPQPTNIAGNSYTGSIAVSYPESSTEVFPVTMNVTALPIAQASVTQVTEQLAVGAPVGYAEVSLSNSGLGTLAISGVMTSISGITATTSGTSVLLAFDPSGLSPNTYAGSVSIASNAANSPTTIPVTFQVVPAGPPVILYHGVVDDAIFGADGIGGAPGEVMALFGQQLSFVAPTVGPAPPLAMQLGGASVFVNGEQAPLYYASYGQINFQMPTDTPIGTAQVQVMTNGQTSNAVSVNVLPRAQGLLLIYGTGGYGAIVDASQGNGNNVLPMPPSITIPGFITQPARPGDVLTIYAIGLGPTNPSVMSGQPAPDGVTAPLAQLTEMPTVQFNHLYQYPVSSLTAIPTFAGLSPHSAGLYQINVAVPANCPSGAVEVSAWFSGTPSNAVYVQVQ
jgi:uncharacterized protein (TIGR03437 family)